ncbi:leucine-rich repeat domain-containing protein [Acinetobacter sp. ANC5681]|uniref:leucine-rich repeat domain-containing protein n=1 Tax=Acinetobacter sp. ANC5681 TaxID=2929504 RepID=UPI00201A4819|nr:leucine-rich repeat domain-containing protein [Acinetobacter sp. ANC5681]MCL5767335.1 leucine-rich repeat domain-containing protein [Acinetobacter sp. ANC5681]
MAIYTGTADASGNFDISFGGNNYTAAQKVTVTSTKDGGSKTVELYAPSGVTGGGIITWTGTTVNFPRNIGVVTIGSDVNNAIAPYAFYVYSDSNPSFGYHATGLVISAAKTIGTAAFYQWSNCRTLSLPSGLKSIGSLAFAYFYELNTQLTIPDGVTTIGAAAFSSANKCPKVVLPSTLTSIGDQAFLGLGACTEISITASTPPTIDANTFLSLNASCVIKVPSASLTAYQTATYWSDHASKMVGV